MRRLLAVLCLAAVAVPVLAHFAVSHYLAERRVVAHQPAPTPEPVLVRPMPEGLLPDQMPARGGCPRPYVEVQGHPGCWIEMTATPPCGEAYEYRGRCYEPKHVTRRMPAVEDPRRPGLSPWK